ncbi:hypothetical protein KP509_18G060900 [Ceratopteris richardii]|nr:hypothetical protein KP509_18G060900 [Ceratopteris richardii]
MAEKVPSARPQRVKRFDPPNKTAHFEQIGALQGQIDSLQHRISEIKSILDNRSQNKRVASPEFVAARKKLADLNATFKEAVDRKKAHREELELVKEKLRGTGSRSGLPEVSIEELDEQIQKLAYRQTHTTLPIDEEKRLIIQIERLKRSRDSLLRHSSQAEQDQGTRAELIDLIRKVEQDLNNLKEEQQRQRQILADLREKESALSQDIPALIQERNEAYEAIKSLRDDIKQLKAEFAVKEEEYWRREKEWRAQQALERRLRAEKGRADWLEREKIRKQRELENFVEPYTDEIIMCEQLLSYMLKNVPLDDSNATSEQQQKSAVVTPEGFGIALIGKKNRNEDELGGWFAGSGGKKGKKSRGSSTSRSKLHEKISLSIDALSSFGKLKISPPVTYGDVAKSIEELKLKKDQYAEMQKADRELREKGGSAGSQALDGVDVEVHEPATKEPLLARAQVLDNGSSADPESSQELCFTEGRVEVVSNGSCADHHNSQEFSDTERGAGAVDIGSSHYHENLLVGIDDDSTHTQGDLKNFKEENVHNGEAVDESTDILNGIVAEDIIDDRNNSQLDDQAHLETFEFSEAHLNTEEDAHIEEQAAESGVASVIFDCTTQIGTAKEFTNEDLNVKEPVLQLVENGVCLSECETVKGLVKELGETPSTCKELHNTVEKTENVANGDPTGVLQVDQKIEGFHHTVEKTENGSNGCSMGVLQVDCTVEKTENGTDRCSTVFLQEHKADDFYNRFEKTENGSSEGSSEVVNADVKGLSSEVRDCTNLQSGEKHVMADLTEGKVLPGGVSGDISPSP